MRLFCWTCHKSVSNELPEDTTLRAICICPECIENAPIELDGFFNRMAKILEKDDE